MSSKTKTFSCKYCDITGIPRNEYKKHIRTIKHRNMFEYSRQCDKVRTQMTVNEKSSSTQHKLTNDGKYVMDFIQTMKDGEKKYNCQYCNITDMSRLEYIKHSKLEGHKINMRNEKKREKISQNVNIVKKNKGKFKVHKNEQLQVENTQKVVNQYYGTGFDFNQIISGKFLVKDNDTGELKCSKC